MGMLRKLTYKSGLLSAEQILKGIDAVEFVYFKADDVVRHPVVAKIISAYEKAEGKQ